VIFNLEGTGYYGQLSGWPEGAGGEGGVSDWYNGEEFASGDFRLKVCRRDDRGGSKGTAILGLPVTDDDGAEEYPYG